MHPRRLIMMSMTPEAVVRRGVIWELFLGGYKVVLRNLRRRIESLLSVHHPLHRRGRDRVDTELLDPSLMAMLQTGRGWLFPEPGCDVPAVLREG